MKVKKFTQLVLGIMLLALMPVNAQNLLVDGDFSTTTVIEPNYGWPPPNVWSTFQGDVDANATVVDGVCNYQILSSGSNTWEIQLAQAGFALTYGHTYRLSFDVKADADRTFGVFLGENGGNWTNYLGSDRYTQNATTEWQTISLDFNVTCVFEYHKLSFELGNINTSMYFDNVMLVDLGPYEPSVGIIGSSLTGWDVDVDMITTDGVNYTVSNLPLSVGRVKFRQDNSWCVNWGGTSFPMGAGYIYGPDIIVSNPGNYDVTFNKESGEYSFTCINNCTAYIGLIGSAVPPDFGSGPDVNMSTADGVSYTLTYTFTDGEAKFRKDDNWDINWGSNSFPAGTASMGGPAIPIAAGTYTISFNIVTGEYNFAFPAIGILGSALAGWNDDIDLQTSDGINYSLADYTFTDGEVKFRQDNNWDVNWGDYSFPTGLGYSNGPNIPVPASTYNVTFNRVTGQYNFMATSCPIAAIQCPGSFYLGNTPGMCGAVVDYPPIIAAPNCGGPGIEITQTGGLPSGSLFPVGMTTNTFVLTNQNGNTATCSFEVYVWDNEPPVVTGLSDYFEPLWPPNHKMVQVPINYSLSDNCGTAMSELWVYCNEPEIAPGDGDKAPDWQILDEHNVLLRAERSGTGTGREYHIFILSHDDSWNYSFNEVIVTVPHDQGKSKDIAVLSGNETQSEIDIPMVVSVWPNPSMYDFNLLVESDSDELIELNISDVSGRLISKQNITNRQTISFGDDLLPGIYFVKVKQGDKIRTVKLLKQ
jgi:hypothetical protein